MGLHVPDFTPIHEGLNRYKLQRSAALTPDQRMILRESLTRAQDIEFLGQRILPRCDELLGNLAARPPFDVNPAQLIEMLHTWSADDPELQKWLADNANLRVDHIASMKAYKTGGDEGGDCVESLEEWQLRLDTELFYYVAHRFCNCLSLLPGLEEIECKEIAIIRNQLLEHPEGRHSGVVMPAFGFRSNDGPVIKAARKSSQANVHPDPGFVHNYAALVAKVSAGIAAAAG